MSAAYVRIAALLAGACLPVVVAACAGDGTPPEDPETDIDAGGASRDGSRTPELDAGKADVDAGVDAGDGAAPARACTDEGWCHTVLPDTQSLRDVWGDGQGTVWTVSEQGNVLRWSGTAWTVAFKAPAALYAVWGSSPTDVWAGGEGGLWHGQGASPSTLAWTPVALEVPITSIWGTSANDIWATGFTAPNYMTYDTGRVFHFTGLASDASTGWEVDPISFATPARYAKVWGTSSTDVWIGGDRSSSDGAAFHRVSDGNGGFTWSLWSTADQPSNGNFRGGGSIGASRVFLLGLGPPETYYTGQSTDSGVTFGWTWHDGFGTGYALTAVWGSSPNDVYVAGIFGRLRHFDGTTWSISRIATQPVIPVTADFSAMWGSGPDDVWVVGAGIALHKRPPNKL